MQLPFLKKQFVQVLLFISMMVFLAVGKAEACSCDNGFIGINNHFAVSDYVVMALVLEFYDSPSAESKFHQIEIQPLEVYKGEPIRELNVWSNKGHGIISSCGISPGKDEYWLIYANEDKNGDYTFGWCSKSQNLTEKSYSIIEERWVENDYTRLLKNLEFLRDHAGDINRDFYVVESGNSLNSFLENYDYVNFDRSFGQYLIHFDQSFEIKSIETLSSLTKDFDSELVDYLKTETEWKPFYPFEPDVGFTHLLGIYHYTESYPFLSKYFYK
jgi:hypothetical protein